MAGGRNNNFRQIENLKIVSCDSAKINPSCSNVVKSSILRVEDQKTNSTNTESRQDRKIKKSETIQLPWTNSEKFAINFVTLSLPYETHTDSIVNCSGDVNVRNSENLTYA